MIYKFSVYNNDTGEVLYSGEEDSKDLMNRDAVRNMIHARALGEGIDFLSGDIRIRLLSTDELARDLNIESLMEKHSITQTQLSKRFGIPYKTIQNWKALGKERRKCPDYVLRMMDEILTRGRK